MKRRLLPIVSAVSLLLFVAAVALWVRSYRLGFSGEFLGLLESHHTGASENVWYAGIYSSHGRLGLGLTQFDVAPGEPNRHHYPEGKRLVWGEQFCWERHPFTRWPAASKSWTGIDMRLTWKDPVGQTMSRRVAIPHWPPVVASAVLPAILFGQYWRRYRRRRAGRCIECGYDLRGTPQRCPECGMAAVA
jgi:hypothetical protein